MWPVVDQTLLCRWLIWSLIAKWPRILNSTCKGEHMEIMHRTPEKELLILVTFRDLSLPELNPDSYLHGTKAHKVSSIAL